MSLSREADRPPAASTDLSAAFIKRQSNVQNKVAANAPAMTDANGNVLAFDSKNVYLDMVAKGL